MTSDWGPFTTPAAADQVRWTLRKDSGRIAQCRIVPHALGFELRVDVDGETHFTQVHRIEADADIHAATLEDAFLGKGWSAAATK